MSRAADRWREQLAAWAIPQPLLDAVPDSPYSWSPELWKRAQDSTIEVAGDPTTEKLTELLQESGALLDVGAGTGRVSLPFAARGHPVTAVERDPQMAAALRETAAETGLEVDLVEGSWPEVAARVTSHDVVVSAHVVYDVAEIGPFLEALHRTARRGVVLEVTARHPWTPLRPLYATLHDLEQPSGPTADDLVEVIRETLGATPAQERRVGSRTTRFVDRAELLDFYRRRLVLPEARLGELEGLLDPLIVADGDWVVLDLEPHQIVTTWWDA